MRKLVLFSLLSLLAGCSPAESEPSSAGDPVAATIVDHGNGVLYFDHEGGAFGNALSAYLKEHPTQYVTAITGDGNGGYGRDRGYFVTVMERDTT